MASPAIASEPSPYANLWREFRQQIRRQVCECNAIAGDALWTLLSSGNGGERFAIVSAKRPARRLECSLDAVLGFINCALHGRAKAVRFRCVGGLLQDGERACTVVQATALVLDHLVGSEEL
jgi:hypothetical protein